MNLPLKSVRINNFGALRSFGLDFSQPVTYITGPNFSGKTTLIEAILFAYTGICRGVDAGGRGSEVVVTAGEPLESLLVKLETERGIVSRAAKETPNSAAGQAIASRVGIQPGAVMVSLWWDRFITLPPADAKAMLMDALGVSINKELVEKVLGPTLFERVKHMRFNNPDDIDRAYRSAYEERTIVGRELKGLKEVSLDQFPEEYRKANAAQASAAIESIKTKVSLLEDKLRDMREAMAKKTGKYEALEARVQDTREAVKQLEKLLEEAKAAAGTEAFRKHAHEAYVESVGAVKATQAELDKLIDLAKAQHADLEVARRRHAALDMLDGVPQCPTCSHPITAAKVKKLKKDTETAMHDAGQILSKAEDSIAAKKRELADREKASQEALQKHSLAASKAGEIAQIEETLVKMKQAEARAYAEFNQAKPMADPQQTLPTGPEQKDAMTPQALEERIAKGNEKLAGLQAYLRNREEYERIEAKRAGLTAKHAQLEELCKIMGPNGALRASAIEEKLDWFVGICNNALAPFGKRLRILLDPMELLISDMSRPSIETGLKRFSDSERLRVSFAIQAAFAVQSGFGVIAVDDVARLDYRARMALPAVIKEAFTAGVKQVILASTIHGDPAKFKAPQIPGWEFVLMGADREVVA